MVAHSNSLMNAWHGIDERGWSPRTVTLMLPCGKGSRRRSFHGRRVGYTHFDMLDRYQFIQAPTLTSTEPGVAAAVIGAHLRAVQNEF